VRGAVRFRRASRGCQGQALVEFALVVPVVFLLIGHAINFGGFIYDWITIANASRAAAQYAILGGASANLPTTATAAQITDLITQETSSLPGTTPTVTVCQNDNDTMTPSTCATTDPPKDPEAPTYISLAVDVTYTFTPIAPAFSFTGLFPATIHRRATMRIIQ
jgi:Flp pilus assembly protein TadG